MISHPTRLLILSATLLATPTTRASQVHYDDVTLGDLVERSDLILLIEPTELRRQAVDLPKGRRGPSTFDFAIQHAKVIEVLHGSYAQKQITIAPAHLASSLHVHALYYLDGTSKSPIYERYTPAQDPKQRQIVFLRKLDKPVSTTVAGTSVDITRFLKGVEHAFVLHGAREHESQKAAVQALLAAPSDVP